jgi:hypothetical protein
MYIIRHPILPVRSRAVPDWDGRDVAAELEISEARLQNSSGSAMGTFVWWFVREADGEVKSLSMRKADEFLDGKLAIPSRDNEVRLVLVAGPTEDRRALGVQTLQFTKHPVDARGIHDRWPSMVQAMEHLGAFNLLAGEPPDRGENVIPAEQKFQTARYMAKARSKPTPADWAALKTAINSKAKHRIV